MFRKTELVFICSPYRGDTEANVAKAKEYARFAALCGYSPIVPHLLFPQFLDDGKPDERIKGIELGVLQMKHCDELWIFGTAITDGMEYEIEKAREMGIRVRLFDKDGGEMNPATLKIDDRADGEYRRKVNGLKFS